MMKRKPPRPHKEYCHTARYLAKKEKRDRERSAALLAHYAKMLKRIDAKFAARLPNIPENEVELRKAMHAVHRQWYLDQLTPMTPEERAAREAERKEQKKELQKIKWHICYYPKIRAQREAKRTPEDNARRLAAEVNRAARSPKAIAAVVAETLAVAHGVPVADMQRMMDEADALTFITRGLAGFAAARKSGEWSYKMALTLATSATDFLLFHDEAVYELQQHSKIQRKHPKTAPCQERIEEKI